MQELPGIFSLFFRKTGSLQDSQVLLGQGDIHAAALLQYQHVLDADAEAAGQIDAGLGRHSGSQRQGVVVGRGSVGSLMDLHTHAVAEAVAEIGSVARILDDLPGGGVHIVAGSAGLGGGNTRQLGLKHRVLAALCGWIPILNIWYLRKIIRITADEAEFETEKWELDTARAESEICKTKYPILLVHGVFFRDFRYVNYWGRIPKELQRNGATVHYGQQQSAAAVEDSGRELADRIRQILAETGCEKVNIIAHSKGGLDSRAAIAHAGCAPCVASLTTINTPHRGCIFAEYLLKKIPAAARQKIADTYNATLKRLGDEAPDFLAAVTDLTASACEARNAATPDAPGVFYQSVMSYCRKAQHGKFPLNMTYPLVKHFDGLNDGLVAVDSAKWGDQFTLLEPRGHRGISHGDVVDLNRENIPGFDVREFYVSLVADLKNRGF